MLKDGFCHEHRIKDIPSEVSKTSNGHIELVRTVHTRNNDSTGTSHVEMEQCARLLKDRFRGKHVIEENETANFHHTLVNVLKEI